MKNVFIKAVLAATLTVTLCFANVASGYAYSNDETGSPGWCELEDGKAYNKVTSVKNFDAATLDSSFGEPQWILRKTASYEFSNGVITLKSYTMELLNDTELCKGVTSHSNYMYGYVRARFESLIGVVVEGSDSFRVRSYYGSTAETPTNPEYVGWNGIAHTYCGAE